MLMLPLRTGRLTLRPLTPEDLEPLLAIYADPSVARYLLGEPWTREQAEVQIARRLTRTGLDTDAGALALVVAHNGAVVGDIALWMADRTRRKVEIGWVIGPAYAGHGFATEAASGLIRAAVLAHSLHRVEAQLDARNAASARVCERIGMTREAHLRQNWWSKGEWTDTLIYGLLASELPSGGAIR